MVHHPRMTDIQFKLRLPADLKAKIEAAAEQGGRSLTAEVVRRLEISFDSAEERDADADKIIEAARRIQELIKIPKISQAFDAYIASKAPDQPPTHKKPRTKRG
jgi:hypothetical protein